MKNHLSILSKTSQLAGFMLLGLLPFAFGDDSSPASSEPSHPALTFPFSYTGEGLANLSGGYKQGAIYEGLLSIGIKGDLEKLLGWKGGSFLVSGLYPHGASLSDKYVHDFNAVSNIDAYDSPRLYEAWLEQDLAEGKLNLRIGQILADTEFFVSDNAAIFINGAFGAIPLVSQNLPAAVFPVAAPGIRIRCQATDTLSLQLGIFDGNVGDAATDNHYGTDWRMNLADGALAIAEAAWIRKDKGERLRGVYKVGVFFRRADDGEDLYGIPRRTNGGAYFIVDQQLWRKEDAKDQGLSGFLRIGSAPADRNTVPFYCDAGFNYKGLIPGRDKDIAGIAMSYTKVSNDLCDNEGNPVETHHETILEATYKIQVKEWFTIQPDCQYIFNPGACEKADNALVAGVRFNVSF